MLDDINWDKLQEQQDRYTADAYNPGTDKSDWWSEKADYDEEY